jgi:hypothetical protein
MSAPAGVVTIAKVRWPSILLSAGSALGCDQMPAKKKPSQPAGRMA